MPGVFISYRRQDSAGYTGRLFDILSVEFGKDNTYMDLDTIVGGDDFAAVIEDKVSVSDVLVAVIGSRWLIVTDENGNRRLDNPRDFVRIEITKALERGIRVVPVLVGGANMPREDDLPPDLKALCERQAVEIRDSHFHADARQLIDALNTTLPRASFRLLKANPKRFVPVLLFAAGIIVVLSGMLLFQQRKPATRPEAYRAAGEKSGSTEKSTPRVQREIVKRDDTRKSVNNPMDVAGKWTATVKYDWGDTYKELFAFEVNGQEVSGMAGFLGEGHGRTILDGKIAGNRISFMTKTFVTSGAGDQTSEDKHYYKGQIEGKSIRFSMITDSNVQPHAPIHFTAYKSE